jgi:molybdate transport system substrate-binding protein
MGSSIMPHTLIATPPFTSFARAARTAHQRAVPFALTCLALLASSTPIARAAGEQQLTVSGAASLTAVFGAIAPAFTKAHANANVQTNFAGSSTLVQQIREGAPVDVFASADESNMQKLVDAGDVAGAPAIFATNRLAILVAKGNPKEITGIADLAKPGLIVSLCGPAVPAGKYAREIFAKAGVAVPESSQELDVKAVVTRVALGEADAGIVYVTDVLAAGDKVAAVEIPDALNVVARYPVAVLKRAQKPDLARTFVEFLTGSEGQSILKRFGFLAP